MGGEQSTPVNQSPPAPPPPPPGKSSVSVKISLSHSFNSCCDSSAMFLSQFEPVIHSDWVGPNKHNGPRKKRRQSVDIQQ